MMIIVGLATAILIRFVTNVSIIASYLFTIIFITFVIKQDYIVPILIVIFPFITFLPSLIQVLCIGLMIIGIFSTRKHKGIIGYHIVGLLFITFIITLSYLFGANSQANIAILAIMCYTLFIGISFYITNNIIYYRMINALLISAVSMILYSVIQYGESNSLLKFGRLAFNNNIRSMANACVMPLTFFFTGFLSGEYKVKKGGYYKKVVISIICIAMIMTTSRGAIFALIGGIAYTVFFSKSGYRGHLRGVVILCMLTTFYLLLRDNNALRLDRLFDENNINGRDYIWNRYLQIMLNRGIISIVFGLGPGDGKRLFVNDVEAYYIHSTFLDYFFSYGILGLSVLILYISTLLIQVRKSKSAYLGGSLTTMILLFSTHGSITSFMLYIVTGIIVGLARSERLSKNNLAKV